MWNLFLLAFDLFKAFYRIQISYEKSLLVLVRKLIFIIDRLNSMCLFRLLWFLFVISKVPRKAFRKEIEVLLRCGETENVMDSA